MSFGIATRNGVSLGLGTTPSLTKVLPYATLRLNFAGIGALDSILTFTRASSQTYFDSTGTLQTATTNVAAFDYNPTTLVPLGLSMWEARTNSIRNNTMVGAVAGTPGTVPTNWFVNNLRGLTQQVVNTTTVNGISKITVRFSGTPSSSGRIGLFFDTYITATSAQVWNESSFVAMAAGSMANITNLRNQIDEYTVVGAILITTQSGADITPTAAIARYNSTWAALNVATTGLLPCTSFVVTNGQAVDITLDFGMPQLELGAFATPVIATTTTAATRAAPACSTTNLGWYNATQGTFVSKNRITALPSSGANSGAFEMDDGTFNNVIGNWTSSTGAVGMNVRSGGVVQAGVNLGTAAANSEIRIASAYATNDFAGSFNAGTIATDTSGTVPVVTTLNLGNIAFGQIINGWIASLTYYPLRLPNATLQSLST